MAIYEERRIRVHKGKQRDYLAWCEGSSWPALAEHGVRPMCLLEGLIGDPSEELLQIMRYPDLETWEAAQEERTSADNPWVVREEARILQAISSRPKDDLPVADHRPIYGYRRFRIPPRDAADVAEASAGEIWPSFEAQGACILGLWKTAATTEPLEIILLTGYRSVAHWEGTRENAPRPAGFDPEVWETGWRAARRRRDLALETWVCLMRALRVG
jgi:hypothetical protein